MAKTKPIGVRFDEDLLSVLKEDHQIESPQKALNFLSIFYRDHKPGKVNFTEAFKDLPLTNKDASKTDSNPKDVQSSGQEKEGVETAKKEARIAELEKELKSPPKAPSIGIKMWTSVREAELNKLKLK